MNVQTTIWFIFVLWNSLCDIRNKKISLLSCLFTMAAGGLFLIFEENSTGAGILGIFVELIFRSLPGILLLVLSYVGRGAVGAGDGLIVLLTGWFLGTTTTIEVLFWGLLASALFGIGMIIFRKAKQKTEIPFVPFLLLGYLVRKGLLKV